MQYLSYVIAAGSFTALLIIWFIIVHRELSHDLDEIQKSIRTILMHESSCEHSQGGTNAKQAEKMLEISKRIYFDVCAQYNHARQKPFHRIPAKLMGFKAIDAKDLKKK